MFTLCPRYVCDMFPVAITLLRRPLRASTASDPRALRNSLGMPSGPVVLPGASHTEISISLVAIAGTGSSLVCRPLRLALLSGALSCSLICYGSSKAVRFSSHISLTVPGRLRISMFVMYFYSAVPVLFPLCLIFAHIYFWKARLFFSDQGSNFRLLCLISPFSFSLLDHVGCASLLPA